MRPLRVAVTGLAATYPYGGVFWDYLSYALGLTRLGHDVIYVEDPRLWCYSPARGTFVEHGADNAAVLARRIGDADPGLRWFYRDATGNCFGMPWSDVVAFCARADLFLHVSMSCWMRPEYFAAGVVAFVDSDPMYTQASVPGYVEGTLGAADRERVEMLRAHDVFFTFAANVGRPGCAVPTDLFDWRPTRQPVVLDLFERATVPVARRRRATTTVGSWQHAKSDPPVVNGVICGGKSGQFDAFADLPARSPLPMRLALSGGFDGSWFTDRGFVLDDPEAASGSPASYRSYLADSLAEWSVAKQAYVDSRSGWFSCRSACYLALGVPVVVQDTGFAERDAGFAETGASGPGVFGFSTTDEALAAIERIAVEPRRQAAAARHRARHFESGAVLGELLSVALETRNGAS